MSLATFHFNSATEGESDSSDDILEESLKRFTENLRDKGVQCSSTYLNELLRLCDCSSVPKTKTEKLKKLLVYFNAKREERAFILKPVKELQDAYHILHQESPPTSWQPKT